MRCGLNDLRVIQIATIGTMQLDLEAVWKARIGQKFLSSFKIKTRRFELFRGAKEAVWQQLPRRNGFLLHDAVNDGHAVQCHGKRLSHALVAQGVFDLRTILGGDEGRYLAELVKVEIDHAVGNGADHRHVGIGLEALDVCGRNILDEVNVASQKGRHAGGRRGQKAEAHFFPCRLASPVNIVAG